MPAKERGTEKERGNEEKKKCCHIHARTKQKPTNITRRLLDSSFHKLSKTSHKCQCSAYLVNTMNTLSHKLTIRCLYKHSIYKFISCLCNKSDYFL